MEKYSMGLDIGISSVGWGLVELDEDNNPKKIIDTGVKIFSPGEVPKTGASKNLERREKRSSRRVTRRKEFRVDRIKQLLNLNGYLGEPLEGNISEISNQLTDTFNNTINKFYQGQNISPYELKVESLDRKLNKDELCIILVHYAKHRGYKSNRNDNKEDKELGKVKESIKENATILEEKKYRTISEMFLKDDKFKDRIRNSKDNYRMSVTREMYQKEIETVLDSQIKFGLITEDFKNKYLKIWSSQRHYAKGPGGNSKYGGNLIEKMTGKCKFDKKPRAPKCAPSSELFVLLTKLLNFRYKKIGSNTYKSLAKEEISKIITMAKSKDSITYTNIYKEINVEFAIAKGLLATKKENESIREQFLKITNLEQFSFSDLTDEQRELYNNIKIKEINKREFAKLKNYTIIRKEFIKQLGTENWDKVKDNYEFLDTIAEILTNYKLNEDVIKQIKALGIDEIYTDTILSLPNFKDHMMLSLDLIRSLNNLMIEGINYDKAMEMLGCVIPNGKEKQELLIPINSENEITNQRVIRALSQARGIINSIIKKYGQPEVINIETARELSKTREERNKLTKQRDENKEKNSIIKKHLVDIGLFKTEEVISSTDVLKFKLWQEQETKCAYCLKPIQLEDLFDKNLVQIDHILPYSRTFDDSYFNKTLVYTEQNQEKGNSTPYEWIGNTDRWKEYRSFIEHLNIPEKKKDNYLLTELTAEIESDYRNQNLNDTKYITKYLLAYIKANLIVNTVGNPSGAITSKLRNYWHLNGLTHSLESETYWKTKENDQDVQKKNRENHLHHAMDALIIAVVNSSLIKKIADYEKYKSYLDNKPLSELIRYAESNDKEFDLEKFKDNGKINIKEFKDYIKELREKNYYTQKNNSIKTIVPEPYEKFSEEAKVRVYEQDKQVMDFKLKEYGYTDEELKSASPIIPKFAKNKVGGKLHEETYYGIKKQNGEITHTTSRIDIASESFNLTKLKQILEIKGGSKEVYETIKKWLGTNKNGKEAFKSNGGYPINKSSGNIIKKIKISSEYKGTGHVLKNNIVKKSDIQKIEIYKRIDDDKLYFTGYDALDVAKIKNKIDIEITLWSAQGKNYNIYRSQLNDQHLLYLELYKNDLIEIVLRNGKKGRGYTTGFSNGKLEIKSILGDNYDIVGKNGLFKNFTKENQYSITISTIKSIKKMKLSNLGKIE